MSESTPEFLALQAVLSGRFSLDRELGRGGMGIVYLARDVSLERDVAIKLFPPHFARDLALRERFLREARTAAQLAHPNIVPIHAVEEHGDLLFFVMTYVEGDTLSQRVRRAGALGADAAVRMMQEVAWALGYAHGRGIIHRDIKPDNILIERATGRAMVADFGIARITTQDTLSPQGTLMGTLQYMSPEQASTEAVDGRSDIYSLGATAFFALTGAPPIDGPTLPVILTRLLTEPAPSIAATRPELPAALSEAVTRCLEKEPSARFASADDLAAALRDALPVQSQVSPEVRTFLREYAIGRTLPMIGVGLMTLAGAFHSIEFMDARSTAAVVVFGGMLTALLPLSLSFNFARLRRTGTTIAELERALREEQSSSATDTARRRDDGEAAQVQLLGAFGYVYIAIALFIEIVAARVSGRFVAPPIGVSAIPVAGIVFGVATIRYFRPGRKLPKWLNRGRPRNFDGVPLGILRRLIKTRLFRAWYAKDDRSLVGVRAEAVPTSTLLVSRVSDLLNQLPDDLRARLGAAKGTAEQLERALARLRSHADRVSAALAEIAAGSPARAEFSTELDRVRARVESGTAALEGMRVELLRLHAGLASVDGITMEIEKAKEVGIAIDAELAGLDEVKRVLRG